ncbi:hypothetical protein H5410_035896, partial [Solanum commersonii]
MLKTIPLWVKDNCTSIFKRISYSWVLIEMNVTQALHKKIKIAGLDGK